MPEPGWYPDPGGRSGHYRFWDGQHWGLSTTPDLPGQPPSDGGPPSPRRSRGTRWILAATAAAVVLVLVAVGALVLRERSRPTAAPTARPSASAPAGGTTPPARGGPVRPSASPSAVPSGEAGPTASPTPGSSPSAGSGPCLFGSPYSRQDYPRDGRVHGGNLSFPLPRGWVYPGRQTDSFTWAYDVGEADVQVQQQWYSAYAVGAVSVADGFEDPETAAELMMTCTLASPLYRHVTSRTDLTSSETTVDGYRAWTLRSEVRADDDRTTFEGDTVQVTVVDLDSPEALAFFWGCAPIGDAGLTEQLDEVADRLRVG
ncbi:DUF2510 domain-containing protein [Microlunatus flavus]|uniref:DUF2510 domain-containing protein n=1 Tax=Microlunatus flavus TaxID=1036181 RepID=A0A1H9KHW5_9ACTN|nr:DUF2510 domain-containing protein [Microlunatus flavus]SEQ98669.1 Protein of unknown function [Microlunatus flavus]